MQAAGRNALPDRMLRGVQASRATFEEFSALLDDYIEFYDEGRIKRSLGWMSPNEYRRSLSLVA